MKLFYGIFIVLSCCGCRQENDREYKKAVPVVKQRIADQPDYETAKSQIADQRKKYAATYFHGDKADRIKLQNEITDFWVSCISTKLYGYWENTPWDFNGRTTIPKSGTIACGYFVTTVLQDMDVALNRTKLATCASSVMMKSLVPHQQLKNLSYPGYNGFIDSLQKMGKGVYVTGLDFHTGFIVNDGKDVWFIHSNYIGRKGVTKELAQVSAALRSSGTRWLVSLTGDNDFIQRWLAKP